MPYVGTDWEEDAEIPDTIPVNHHTTRRQHQVDHHVTGNMVAANVPAVATPPPFGARTRQARLLRSKNPATPAMWLNGPCVCTRTVQSTGDFSMGCTKGASHQLSQNPAITGLSTVNVCALNKGTTQWRKHTSARKADVSCADRAATRGYSHHAREPQT